MTDAELQGIALQALNMAKKDYEAGTFICLMASYFAGEGLRRMKKIEDQAVQELGKAWLNSPPAKDAFFSTLRIAFKHRPPDAFVFVTASNCFKPTGRLRPEEWEALQNAGHKRHHEAVKEGLLTMRDSLTAVAQSPRRVCLYVQIMDKGGYDGPPELAFSGQEDFEGALKVYGSDGQ